MEILTGCFIDQCPRITVVVRSHAPGKCILFGEHAVVYGHPAIAAAIDLRTHLSVTRSQRTTVNGEVITSRSHPHLVELMHRLSIDVPLEIEIRSEVPRSAGLGSSAALAVAFVGAVLELTGHPGDRGDLIEQAAIEGHLAEARAQGGRASPIDTTTAAYGGLIMVQPPESTGWVPLGQRRLEGPEGTMTWEVACGNLGADASGAHLIIAHSGETSSTSAMVERLRDQLDADPSMTSIIDHIGRLTTEAGAALLRGDLDRIGALMDENHDALKRLDLSTDRIDRLVNAARASALGAKVTGAGGGGCIVAISTEPERTHADLAAMDAEVWISDFGGAGLTVS